MTIIEQKYNFHKTSVFKCCSLTKKNGKNGNLEASKRMSKQIEETNILLEIAKISEIGNNNKILLKRNFDKMYTYFELLKKIQEISESVLYIALSLLSTSLGER